MYQPYYLNKYLAYLSVLMYCIHSRHFEREHKSKKRRLVGSAKENAVKSIVE